MIGEKWKTFCRTDKSTHGCPLSSVSSPCLFWLWTLIWLESPFLAGNVCSQVGQQCQTDLKEVVLSYVSFEVCFCFVFFFLECDLFQMKWGNQRWSSVTVKRQLPHCRVSGHSDFKFSFKQSLYFTCWPWAKCSLSLFAAWIFSWSTLISQIFE